MAGETQLLDLTATPTALDTAALGGPGTPVQLLNVGDDPAFMLMSPTRPDAGVGYPLPRGKLAKMTLPRNGALDAAPAWLWAPKATRVAVTPLSGPAGVAPGATGVIRLTRSPLIVPAPAGTAAGGRVLVTNAGARPAFAHYAPVSPTPSPAGPGEVFDPGATVEFVEDADPTGSFLWCWADGETVLLATEADDGWSL